MEDKAYCPQCGLPNDKSNQFCGSCGASIDATQATATQVVQQPTQVAQQPTQVVHVHQQKPKMQQVTALGIIGLVIGLVSFLILSWMSLFSFLWMPFLYLGLAIIGIIFSAISIRKHTAIGVVGLITGILGALSQIGWCIFVGIFYFLASALSLGL